ncbi:hypothetical protein GCM10022408_03890 [Hymenobacter fastidiosus]|uniref:Uncharacterized protein n=1 Tax=Hymenobacter fastidiosus TaxID=486264 RepID=A0ABP7REY4_9BACT
MTLLPFLETPWPEARAIYEAGIATGTATFTTAAPTWQEWNQGHLPHSRLVATDAAGNVRGGPPCRRCRGGAGMGAWPK